MATLQRTPSVCRAVLLALLLLAVPAGWTGVDEAAAQSAPDIPTPTRTEPLPDAVVQSHALPDLSPTVLDRIQTTIEQQRAEKLNLSATDAKLHPMLRGSSAPTAKSTGSSDRHPMLQYDTAGRVRVMVHVSGPAALAEAQAAGLVVNRYDAGDGYATGALFPSDARGVAGIAGVSRIQPLVKAGLLNAGSVVTEGDAALNADDLRAALGADGSGVRIGIISDGTGGLAASQASGDLPATVTECPISTAVGGSVVDNTGAEGTAMLEIVHDIAPGAELLFCPAFGPQGEAGLAQSILSLSNDLGADVIVDDVAYLTEPYWEDGIVAQAVNQVVADGVAYYSSAGNGAQRHYEAGYVDTVPGNQFVFPADAHDFGLAAGGSSSIVMNGLVGGTSFAPQNFFAAFMQWTEPFGAAASDYDLYLFDRNGNVAGDPAGIFPVGGLGLAIQNGDDDPLEIAFVVNQTPNIEDVLLVIDRFSGDPNEQVEINFNGALAILTFNEPRGSVWGHAAATGAQAIAAIDVNDPGLDDAEAFSSQGPSEIFFPAPETRMKPDITAVDGVSVTGNGGFPSTFFGTSASAPHVAAVAALLLDLNPLLSPADVNAALAATALDRGDPGFDFTFGAGLVDALAAGQSVLDTTPPVCASVTVQLNEDGVYEILSGATDAESGIASVEWSTLDNAEGFVDAAGPFVQGDVYAVPGAPTSIQLRGVQIDPSKGGAVFATVTNNSGLSSECDPVVEKLQATVPSRFELTGNYPNPVTAGTRIGFQLAESGPVRLEVFDLLGRKVATLVDREMDAGSYEIEWPETETKRLSSGTYVYRLHAGDFLQSRRMVLVR